MNLLILAAGKGNRIYDKINTHKCLLKVKNKTLIEKIIDDAKEKNLFNKIYVVVGFKKNLIKEKLKKKKINYITNKSFNEKEMTHSLFLGLKQCTGDTVVCYSDIYFSKKIFKLINKNRVNNKIVLPVNLNWRKIWKVRKKKYKDDCETLKFNNKKTLTEIGNKIKNYNEVQGQYMGIFYISKDIKKIFLNLLNYHSKKKKLHITNFLNLIKEKIKITCLSTKYYWYEFDDVNDYENFYN